MAGPKRRSPPPDGNQGEIKLRLADCCHLVEDVGVASKVDPALSFDHVTDRLGVVGASRSAAALVIGGEPTPLEVLVERVVGLLAERGIVSP